MSLDRDRCEYRGERYKELVTSDSLPVGLSIIPFIDGSPKPGTIRARKTASTANIKFLSYNIGNASNLGVQQSTLPNYHVFDFGKSYSSLTLSGMVSIVDDELNWDELLLPNLLQKEECLQIRVDHVYFFGWCVNISVTFIPNVHEYMSVNFTFIGGIIE